MMILDQMRGGTKVKNAMEEMKRIMEGVEGMTGMKSIKEGSMKEMKGKMSTERWRIKKRSLEMENLEKWRKNGEIRIWITGEQSMMILDQMRGGMEVKSITKMIKIIEGMERMLKRSVGVEGTEKSMKKEEVGRLKERQLDYKRARYDDSRSSERRRYENDRHNDGRSRHRD
ncbi:hypothetical protein ACFX2C_017069 [Malus domestica]